MQECFRYLWISATAALISYNQHYPLLFRAYRDVRLLSIGGGADEVMLSIICKYMDLLPKPAAKQKKK